MPYSLPLSCSNPQCGISSVGVMPCGLSKACHNNSLCSIGLYGMEIEEIHYHNLGFSSSPQH